MLERPQDPGPAEDPADPAPASAAVEAPASEAPAADEAPEGEAPRAEEAAPAAPKTAAPETAAPEPDAPKTDAPEGEAPRAEEAAPDAPKPVAPEPVAPEPVAVAVAAPEPASPRPSGRAPRRVKDRRGKEGESLAERVARQSRERSRESTKKVSRLMRQMIILLLVMGLGYRFAYPFLRREFLLLVAHHGRQSWSDWAVTKMPEEGDPRAVSVYLRGLQGKDAERRTRYNGLLVRWVTPEFRGAMLDYLKSADKEERRAGLYARYNLHQFDWVLDGEITSRVAAILDADPDDRARIFAALIFTKYQSGPPASYCPIVEKGCKDRDISVRRECLNALARTRDQAYTELFAAALKDEVYEVRLAGLRGLAYVGDHRAVDLLAERYEAGDEKERGDIVTLLDGVEDDHVIDLIIRATRDSDPSIAAAATKLLGRRAGQAASQGLLRALDSGYGEVRAEAARALGQRGERGAIPKLIENLKSYRQRGELEALDQALDQLTEAEDIPPPKGTASSQRQTVKAWLAWFEKGEGS